MTHGTENPLQVRPSQDFLNMNFEEMDTERSTGKNDGFWVLWGVFKEYITQNITVAVLRKANSQSIVICRLIKKSNNVK